MTGMNTAELQLLISAKDVASGVIRGVAGALVGSLGGALADVARAAADDEANVLKLRGALEGSGASWEAYSGLIDAQIKKGQGLAFTDTQIRDSLATLVSTTGEMNDSLRIQNIAMDLARLRGIDLSEATNVVAKAAAGNTTQLGRMFPATKEAANATEALAIVQKIAAGQAELYGNSTAGAIFKTKDAVDEWRESIGASLGPLQGVIALLPGFSMGLTSVSTLLAVVTPAQWKWVASTAAAAGLYIALAAAIALVVVALIQIKETVDVVREHWDVFVYALTHGRLNDIPVFGFFFSKVQQVLGLIDAVRNAWSVLTGLFGGGGGGGFSLPKIELPQFGEGGVVPGPVGRPIPIIAHGGERVVPVGGASGGITVVVNVNGDVNDGFRFEQRVRAAVADGIRHGGFRGIIPRE